MMPPRPEVPVCCGTCRAQQSRLAKLDAMAAALANANSYLERLRLAGILKNKQRLEGWLQAHRHAAGRAEPLHFD